MAFLKNSKTYVTYFCINMYRSFLLKATDQPDHVTLVITITLCEFIQKSISQIYFQHQTDLSSSFVHICLIRKINFSYYFSNNHTHCDIVIFEKNTEPMDLDSPNP